MKKNPRSADAEVHGRTGGPDFTVLHEPTVRALFALGVAGLALRRKIA